MTVPNEAFSMLQNGGMYVMAMFMFLVLVFAPLVYIAVLSKGNSHTRLVKVINAFTELVTAWRTKTRRKTTAD